jgi:hypothetical protein
MIIMIYEWWFVESLSCAGDYSSDSEYMEKNQYYIIIFEFLENTVPGSIPCVIYPEI